MLQRVIQKMNETNLDGLWVTDEKSLNFLIGFDISVGERFVGLFISLNHKPILVLNKLFSFDHPEIDVEVVMDHYDLEAILSQITIGQRIGLDKMMRAQFVLPLIKNIPSTEFVLGSDIVDQLRAIKSQSEIQKMMIASKLNDKVMASVKEFLRPGLTELEVEQFILEQFKANNSDPSFETIVAFGDHGVDPHAIPSTRVLQENESIIIDMGCVVDGYCSDMTRTYFINSNPIEEIYNLVLRANQEAIKAIKPGVTFSDIDKVARDIIEKGGYGEYFTHRLGHGIGREVHEPYDVSQSNNQLIVPNMCFSIEPGIYKPGVDAVRIEDLVYVNDEGFAVRLNNLDKENPVINLK